MKYCVPYFMDFRYFKLVDEIILEYKEDNNNIIDYVEEHFKPEQRVIVDIGRRTEDELNLMLPILKGLHEKHSNMTVKLDSMTPYNFLIEQDIPFFFSTFCNKKDEMYGIIKCGVSDIYIVENLAFSLAEVGEYCKSKGVKVRIIPNMCQYAVGYKHKVPFACQFFVRPEDTQAYEKYVDVFEFVGPLDRMSVLFEIYNNRQWLGDLSDLILGMEEKFINKGILPIFGEARVKCNHNCMVEKCELCLEMQKLANDLNGMGVKVVTEREKDWKITEDEREIN